MKKGLGKALETALKDKDDVRSASGGKVKRIFASKVRRGIFSILTQHPCMSIGDVAIRVQISGNSVLWHLEKMVSAGFLIERKRGKRRLFWPEGLIDENDMEIFFLLSNETAGNILKTVLTSPGVTQKEIASKLKLSHQGISAQAKHLKETSMINTVIEGIHIRYYPTTFLSERSEANYEHSKAFRNFMIERLKAIGERPKIIKSSQSIILIEIGPKTDRVVMEIGLDPFMTAFGFA